METADKCTDAGIGIEVGHKAMVGPRLGAGKRYSLKKEGGGLKAHVESLSLNQLGPH